jgi:YHS domain-containing protein
MLEILLPLFYVLAAGAIWRLLGGILEGLSGRPAGRPSGRTEHGAVHMVRDPVCGTYVVPDHAVFVSDGHTRRYFCSTACRDKYDAALSSRPDSGRPETAAGRTA